MSHTLRFTSVGTISCLYTDAVDLRALGRLHVVRATDIRFDPDSQQWQVRRAGSEDILYANGSRTKCIRWEHLNLQVEVKR